MKNKIIIKYLNYIKLKKYNKIIFKKIKTKNGFCQKIH